MQICKDKDNPDSKATTLGLFISLGVSENCFFLVFLILCRLLYFPRSLRKLFFFGFFGFFGPLQTSLFS